METKNKLSDVFRFLGEAQIKMQKIADSLNVEDKCDVCGSKYDSHGYYTCNCYSPCCGERIIEGTDLCSGCHEHSI